MIEFLINPFSFSSNGAIKASEEWFNLIIIPHPVLEEL